MVNNVFLSRTRLDADGNVVGVRGLMPDIVNILGSYLNFTTRPVTGDGPWGLYQGNGTWTGMVGQLVSRSVDIVSAGLTMTVDRQRAVDFTAPILVEVTNSNLLMQT